MTIEKYGKPFKQNLPEELFDEFQELAKALGLPKKRITATALRVFLDMDKKEQISAYMDTVDKYYNSND